MSAKAISEKPLLRRASVSAARRSKFRPTLLSTQAFEVTGVIVYNFSDPATWTSIGMNFGLAESKGFNSTIYLLEGFKNEQQQIDSLVKDSIENQKSQLSSVASTIKSKLNPIEAWKFDFGRAKAKTLFAIGTTKASLLRNEAEKEFATSVLQSLEAFRNLSINAPAEVESNLHERIKKIIEIADSGRLNKEDKENLMHYLRR